MYIYYEIYKFTYSKVYIYTLMYVAFQTKLLKNVSWFYMNLYAGASLFIGQNDT